MTTRTGFFADGDGILTSVIDVPDDTRFIKIWSASAGGTIDTGGDVPGWIELGTDPIPDGLSGRIAVRSWGPENGLSSFEFGAVETGAPATSYVDVPARTLEANTTVTLDELVDTSNFRDDDALKVIALRDGERVAGTDFVSKSELGNTTLDTGAGNAPITLYVDTYQSGVGERSGWSRHTIDTVSGNDWTALAINRLTGDTVAVDEVATVTAAIQNTGEQAATEDVELTIAAGNARATFTEAVSLDAGETEEATFDIDPADLPAGPGNYDLTVATDGASRSEAGALTVEAAPEPASFEIASLTGATVDADESATVNAVVDNTGDETATQDLELTLTSGETTKTLSESVTLDGGESQSVPFDIDVSALGLSTGNYDLTLATDDASRNKSGALTVEAAPEPASFEITSLNGATVDADESATVNAVVDNTGDETATQDLELTLTSGETTETLSESVTLDGGETQTVPFDIDVSGLGLSAGDYDLTLATDDTNLNKSAAFTVEEPTSSEPPPSSNQAELNITFGDDSSLQDNESMLRTVTQTAWSAWAERFDRSTFDKSLEVRLEVGPESQAVATGGSPLYPTGETTDDGADLFRALPQSILRGDGDRNGDQPDGTITFRTPLDDFASDGAFSIEQTMKHELGHVLGFTSFRGNRDAATPFGAGIEDGVFSGPLAGEVSIANGGHLANGIMEPTLNSANVTDTEIAILGDMGVPVDLA